MTTFEKTGIAAVLIFMLAILYIAGASPSGTWRIVDGPWEDGSFRVQSPTGATMGACLADALCDDSRPVFPGQGAGN